MTENDLSLIENDEQFDSPLDQMNRSPTETEKHPPDPEEMLPLLSHSEASQRMVATRAFCEIQDQRAIPRLIDLLEDDCPLVRVSAAYALGRNISVDAVEPLINSLKNDWNGYVRKGIVWALGNCCDRRSVQPLVHALKTDISAVRLWAASSIAQVAKLDYQDIVASIPTLIECLRRDSLPAVRSNCAWTLGQLCRELPSNVIYATAIDALLEALVEDEDFGVKEDAKMALLGVGDPRALI